MRPLPLLLTVCCISLLSRQLLALRAEERMDTDRLDMINQFFDIPNDTPPSSPSSPPAPVVGPLSKWLMSLVQHHFSTSASSSSDPSLSPGLQKALSLLPLHRSRRHLSSRGTPHHHAQLMRVGCKLGTCQVQNLSHRLYQLIGQRGREDSSPINPKSPHSYG